MRERGHTPAALRAAAEAAEDVAADYWTRPRAATGQRPTTAPPSTTVTAFARLIVGQTWFGTIATRSPIRATRVRRDADDAVLLAQPDDVPVVVAPHPAEGGRRVGDEHPVGRQHLRPGVDDDAGPAPGGATTVVDRERGEVGGPAGALRDLAPVVEDVRARAGPRSRRDSGSRSGTCPPSRPRRPARRCPRPRISSAVSTAAPQASSVMPLALGVVARLRVDVTLVREDAGELEPVERRDPLRELDGAGPGQDAEAVHARVELEQRPDREPALARGARDPERDLVGVDGHGDRRALGQVGEPRELPLADDRIADEDVLDPGVGHHLGLAELRDLHADGAGVELQARDLRQLVRLRVRPQRRRPPRAASAAARSTFARTTSRSSTSSGVSGASSVRAATRSSDADSVLTPVTALSFLVPGDSGRS